MTRTKLEQNEGSAAEPALRQAKMKSSLSAVSKCFRTKSRTKDNQLDLEDFISGSSDFLRNHNGE